MSPPRRSPRSGPRRALPPTLRATARAQGRPRRAPGGGRRAARRALARVRGEPPGGAAGAPSRSFDSAHRVREEIHTHPQRRLMKLRGVMVHLVVVPPGPEIRLIGVVYDKAVSQKN